MKQKQEYSWDFSKEHLLPFLLVNFLAYFVRQKDVKSQADSSVKG